MRTSTPDSNKYSKARFFWAKKPVQSGEPRYLPLYTHLSDAAETARRLWNTWFPENIKRRFSPEHYIFLAAAHDLGKATPAFQTKQSHITSPELNQILLEALISAGFNFNKSYSDASKTRHELASHAILARHKLHDSLCVVLSGHHGKPPSARQLNDINGYAAHFGFDDYRWKEAQDTLFHDALALAGLSLEEARSLRFTRPDQALLSAMIILADWIASDETLFPLVDFDDYSPIDSAKRAESALAKLALPHRWTPDTGGFGLFEQRFGIDNFERKVRPVQAKALTVATYMEPGIMIIEAPMGEGKTEAALAAAEVLAGKNGLRGVYFALPTQATSNAMLKRIKDWIEKFDTEGEKYSIRLAHGKAELNETYRSIKLSGDISMDGGEENAVFVHEWLNGRKKGLLADFAVGTIDHVLMAGLKQKHLVLRHLGLAGKVIILDEVHAYDVYMNSFLLMALAWLGAYGAPVIVLSATLPSSRRRELLDAYTGKINEPVQSLAYPLITYTCNGKVECEEITNDARRSREVSLRRIGGGALAAELESALSGGGCAGVIVNTVGRAQRIYLELAERFGKERVYLLHARLLARERSKLEDELAEMLGPPGKTKNRPENPDKMILVGTQVIEQSLDFDFDILASDLCPMDLLLQRIGRLHRHRRERPTKLREATCLVLETEGELESGAEAIYKAYPLLRTRALLPDKVCLPEDIPRLVAGVYDDENSEEFAETRNSYKTNNEKRIMSAKTFQIGKPAAERKTLVGWLDTKLRDDSEKRGEAAVRDGADSIEVIVIQQRASYLRLLPWIEDGRAIPIGIPDNDLAITLAGCSIRLPAMFGGEWIVDRAIKELEERMAALGLDKTWYASPFLKGSLCLVLDENLEAALCGCPLRYDEKLGLVHEKEAR